ncbi:flagellar biosynthesis protein FlgL [Acetobacter conturbans]|uniref:Flagellar biosynthesis protein FlgL n=1 Tax=Acetobacter conturbans TaxID=1737472 RepID=A0ABX0JVM9_9PROT|nr:flagellar biosynthesis protein FlgL [Acetobacter conturbans]NHN87281.1 flagellar biosynthesis protein FlgL [Acetobacter conturbans]
MSTSVGLYGSSGTAYILQQAVQNLTQQQTALADETSSGMKSSTYVGLGDDRAQALSLDPQITAVSSWQSSISSAQTSLDTTQTALTQISSIATTLSTNLVSLSGTLGQSELSTIVASAQSALSELGTYLNTSSGTGYVFAGQDSQTAPVTDASGLATSELATATSSAVSQLDTLGASAVFADATQYASSGATYTDSSGTTSDLSVFSSALSTDPVSAQSLASKAVIGQSTTISVGVVATEGSSTGDSTTTTGSTIRDLMRNLMIVASLGSADTSSSNFSDLVSQLQSSTSTISTQLTDEEGSLGITQNSLTNQSSSLSTMSVMLTSQLSNVKELSSSDLAAISVQTTTVQEQLEASYTLIADMKGMTLASYM